jgi:hypothetical protein
MQKSKYGIPKDFSGLLKNILNSYLGRYNVFSFDCKISNELFNYLYDNNFINLFSSQSVSQYSPIELLEKIPNRIDWQVVLKRNDLTNDFIKQNIKHINIQHLHSQYFVEYELMLNYIDSNQKFSDMNLMIEKLLEFGKYTYEQFINLVTHLKKNSYNILKYTFEEFNTIFNLYVKNYYTESSTRNIIRLKDFLDINTVEYNLTYMIVEILHKQLTPWDLEYLIHNDLVCYYMGFTKISDELFNIFYDNRERLLKENSNKSHKINPFIYNKYSSYYQIEELINLSIKSGVPSLYVWNYVSYNILDLHNTPRWFWNKHSSSIHWYYAIEKIIKSYNDDDALIFMDWMKDNEIFIVSEFMSIIPAAMILPELFIAYFATIPGFLINVLKLQKLSITLLNYLAENNYLTEQDWDMISNFQLMNPQFIKKYDIYLNWELLKYNQTFCEYDKKLFHRFPSIDMNGKNNFMFMTIEEKYQTLKKYGVNCEIDTTNMTIIIHTKDYINNKLNHYIPEILKTSAICASNTNSLIKDIFYVYTSTNWIIRDLNSNYSFIESNNFNKIVYNFNPSLMLDNNKTLAHIKTNPSLNYKLMAIGTLNLTANHISSHKFIIPYKYLMIVPIINANGNITSLTIINPLGNIL